MAGPVAAKSLDKTQSGGDPNDRIAELELRPLPWPESATPPHEARRPHAHRCVHCDDAFECGGPDQTGECAPLCPPCLWVELGSQLRMYHVMFEAISRRRRKIAQQIGS